MRVLSLSQYLDIFLLVSASQTSRFKKKEKKFQGLLFSRFLFISAAKRQKVPKDFLPQRPTMAGVVSGLELGAIS